MSEISDLNKEACGLVSPEVNVLLFANFTLYSYIMFKNRVERYLKRTGHT